MGSIIPYNLSRCLQFSQFDPLMTARLAPPPFSVETSPSANSTALRPRTKRTNTAIDWGEWPIEMDDVVLCTIYFSMYRKLCTYIYIWIYIYIDIDMYTYRDVHIDMCEMWFLMCLLIRQWQKPLGQSNRCLMTNVHLMELWMMIVFNLCVYNSWLYYIISFYIVLYYIAFNYIDTDIDIHK